MVAAGDRGATQLRALPHEGQKADNRVSSWSGRWSPATWVLVIATLGELALVIALPYFATQDGPLHLASAAVLNHVGDQPYSSYFRFGGYPAPNVLNEFLTAALERLVSPNVTEKIIICFYVVMLPAALRYALRAAGGHAEWLTLLALPATFSFTFLYGFYNFSYGVIAFLVCIGFALRRLGQFSARSTLGLGLLLLLTYTTHAIPLAVALLTLAALVLSSAAAIKQQSSGSFSRMMRPAVPVALAAAPAILLLLGFERMSGSHGVDRPGLRRTVKALLSFGGATYRSREVLVLAVPVLCLLGALVWAVARRWRSHPSHSWRTEDGLLLAAVVTAILCLVVPENTTDGANFIMERLALFPALLLVLWLAYHGFPQRALLGLGVTALMAAVLLGALRLPAQRRLSAQISELQSVQECVPFGSTIAQLQLSEQASPAGFAPLGNEVNRLAAERNGIDLGNNAGYVPFFLIHYLPATNPFDRLLTGGGKPYPLGLTQGGRGYVEDIPPHVDLLGYQRNSVAKVDVVILMGRTEADPKVLDSPGVQLLQKQLDSDYRLITRSGPTGLAEVYSLRSQPSSC